MSEFKKMIPFFLAAIGVVLLAGFLSQRNIPPIIQGGDKFLKINETSVKVELANTEASRKKGLSGRDSLDPNSGMLFVFESKDTRTGFWMKDTKIALDFIWINDGKVSQITDNVQPEPSTPENELKIYTPDRPIDYMLEVGAGFVQKNNIKSGDSVDLSQVIGN